MTMIQKLKLKIRQREINFKHSLPPNILKLTKNFIQTQEVNLKE